MKTSAAKPHATSAKTSPRPLVGWREWLALPQLGVEVIKAKVDTGAKTSALHAEELEVLRGEEGDRVRFRVHVREGDGVLGELLEFPLLDEREIRSSNGQIELRPIIRTELRLGDTIWHAEVTLTTREHMGFNMLLGRSALKHHFWVDPGRSFLQSPAVTESTPDDEPTTP